MDATTTIDRADLVRTYRAGYGEVVAALEGATDAELDLRPEPGAWTAREIVHHLADSETRSATRLRQLIAEDDAVIQGYDQERYAERLHYGRNHLSSLAVLQAVRAASADLLDALEPHEWERAGVHTESGSYSVDDWLLIYADHAHDHADQIRRARQGRP